MVEGHLFLGQTSFPSECLLLVLVSASTESFCLWSSAPSDLPTYVWAVSLPDFAPETYCALSPLNLTWEVGDMAQLGECLPTMCKVMCLTPSTSKPDVMVHICNLSSSEVRGRRMGNSRSSWFCSESEASLGSLWPCLRHKLEWPFEDTNY